MNKWISIKDGLPENNEFYLIYNDNCILFAKYKDKFWQVYLHNGVWSYKHVTHYMPLPKPPKE